MKMSFSLQFLLWSSCILPAFIALSCRQHQGDNFTHQEEFADYLKAHHHLILAGRNIIVFAIPANSCSPCVGRLLERVSALNRPDVRAVVWANSRKEIIPYATTVADKQRISLDTEGNYMWYDLGIFVPRVLCYEDGRLVYTERLSVGNIEKVFAKLNL